MDAAPADGVRIELLGRFRVLVRGVEVGPWPVRRAAELVQLLALAGGRLLRDRVVDALWPHLDAAAGAANLRKAAHHARRALGSADAVVLRGGRVELFPDRPRETDVERFEAAADAALRGDDPAACREAAALHGGDLLPDALYADWTRAPRERLRARRGELLRRGRDWARLVEVDPTDEHAHRELIREALGRGDRPAAVRRYGRLRAVLADELGVRPDRATDALYAECVAGLHPAGPDLVGRQVELARAEAALAAAGRGDAAVLVVRGAAGLGKSALCRRIAARAREGGWTVASVAATSSGGPYAPLVDAVEQLLDRDRGLVARLPVRTRSVLAELTPLAAPAPPLDGPLTRHQVIGALRRVLLPGPAGCALLVLDDAHLADAATLDALLHLAGTSSGRVLVLLAHRPDPAPDGLVRGVARLDRAGRTVAVDLAPLDRGAAAALLAAAAPGRPGAAVVEAAVDLADGNPFLLVELARAAGAGAPDGLPATAWDAVTARFLDLDAGTVAALERLALTGDDLDPAEAVAATGPGGDAAGGALDAALAGGVLVVAGARYRFRHELVRRALVGRIPPHRRGPLHRELAADLAAAGAAPELVARHWLAGDRPAQAVPWSLTAARRAVRLGAFPDALARLDPVLEHAPDHLDALGLRAEALEALGDPRAPAAFAAAARVAPPEQWHEIRARQALSSVRAGDPAAALVALEGVRATTVEGRLAHALALSGAAAMGHADPAVGLVRAQETRRLAVETGDPATIVIATWAEAAAAHAAGDLPSTLRASLHATHALPDLAITVFDGQLCVVERMLYGGLPYPDVVAFADALGVEADRLGAARGRAFATTLRGEARLLTGRLDEADADLADGVRLHRAIGAPAGEAIALQRRAEVALHRGDRPRARALLDEALTVARESNLGFHLLDRIHGTMITAADGPAAALAAVEEAETAVRGALETCPGCRITLAVPAAIAAARAGDVERAAAYEGAAERLTTILMRLPGWYAALDEVRGHRARAAGDAEGAARLFTAAAAAFRDAGHPLDAARCAGAATG